ncbi:hypothetical protein BGZ97_001712 [Linnemannia gamsii]|uniref:HCP-like protein n=1 Tax=Linnemannia gamsii TaxID=64522 RepID=A0A9P6RGA7_9FUNG|nr:hypothetical protein BGZ97_001712 [Linnemannia gamsii]
MIQERAHVAQSSETIVKETLDSILPRPPYSTSTSFTSTDVDLGETILKAESGDAAAQIHLGDIYCDPENGIEQDYSLAMEWYKKAAAQDNTTAQYKLGYLYEKGFGVPQDDVQAFEWYLKSAEQGNVTAQFRVGTCYRGCHSSAVEKNCKASLEWFVKAAEQGMVEAEFMAGAIYMNDEHVDKDIDKAFSWLLKAAEKGFLEAMNMVGRMYLDGEGVLKDETKASEWFLQAAERGFANAQCSIARLYMEGTGVAQDSKRALEWFRKSAEQGDVVAQLQLGLMLCSTKGDVKQDFEEARKWFEIAGREGKQAHGLMFLGLVYHRGFEEAAEDHERARELYLLALEVQPDFEEAKGHLKDVEELIEQDRRAAARKEMGFVEAWISDVTSVYNELKKLW